MSDTSVDLIFENAFHIPIQMNRVRRNRQQAILFLSYYQYFRQSMFPQYPFSQMASNTIFTWKLYQILLSYI